MRILAILISVTLLSGCDNKPDVSLSAASVVGSYIGSYTEGATESFVILADGTFSQSLSVSNQPVYTNSGRWQIDSQNVCFSNIMLAKDVWNLSQGKPRQQDFYRAYWNPYGPMIIFSDEDHFWIEKQTDHTK